MIIVSGNMNTLSAHPTLSSCISPHYPYNMLDIAGEVSCTIMLSPRLNYLHGDIKGYVLFWVCKHKKQSLNCDIIIQARHLQHY